MPFPFELPTTSSVSFTDYYTSPTHPSLPLAATTSRGVLRDVLKKHKRLPPASQASNLPTVQSALNDYIPHLLALDAGLSSSSPTITVTPLKPLTTEWRATLTAPPHPGRDHPRTTLPTLAAELAFALSTLAFAHSLHARAQLHALHLTTTTLSEPQRAAAIAAAMRAFLDAHAIHAHLVHRAATNPTNPTSASATPAAAETATTTQAALAELALAEATLIAVLKDDPYPPAVAEARSKASSDWMFKAPTLPKVRAHLFARLALCAGEHAGRASAGLLQQGGARVDEAVARYAGDLRRAARGKACRFLGVDAEAAGRTGEGIAWVRGARRELGVEGAEGEAGGGLKARVRKGWAEKREDRRVERGADWGADAGRLEEGRVVEMLEGKWVRMNDTVGFFLLTLPPRSFFFRPCFRLRRSFFWLLTISHSFFQVGVQPIPPVEPLLATIPSGREYHTPKPYHPPELDPALLARMRAPPDDPADSGFAGNEDDSADDDDDEDDQRRRTSSGAGAVVGAFPGTSGEYAGSSNYY